jgi:hypothetical protein
METKPAWHKNRHMHLLAVVKHTASSCPGPLHSFFPLPGRTFPPIPAWLGPLFPFELYSNITLSKKSSIKY